MGGKNVNINNGMPNSMAMTPGPMNNMSVPMNTPGPMNVGGGKGMSGPSPGMHGNGMGGGMNGGMNMRHEHERNGMGGGMNGGMNMNGGMQVQPNNVNAPMNGGGGKVTISIK